MKTSRKLSKINDIAEVAAGVYEDNGKFPDWVWCPWLHFGLSPYALRKLCLKFGWNLLSLKASRPPLKTNEIDGVNDDWCPWWYYGSSAHAMRELCLKFGWSPMSLKASRTPSNIDDISRVLAVVNDNFDVPDSGMCSGWCYVFSEHALKEQCLKFGLICWV